MKIDGGDNEKIIEEEILKQHLLARAQISIMLKSYDDIFSSFDPRPYAQRALSDDFLMEARRAALDKEGNVELSFMVPKEKRNTNEEVLIRKRLHEHFKKHTGLVNQEIREIKRGGMKMAGIGIFLILLGAILSFFEEGRPWLHFIIILVEPAGWFTGWTGLDELHYNVKEKKPDYRFYEKLSRAEITFHHY